MKLDLEKLTLALRILGVGEPLRGYGQATSEDIAEKLLANFDIVLKGDDA